MRGAFSCLYRDGIRFVLVQGGEPLLRRDVPEILKDLSAIGVHLTLIKNGRIGRGTVIGQTMLIILRNSTVSIAPTAVRERVRPVELAVPSFLSGPANP